MKSLPVFSLLCTWSIYAESLDNKWTTETCTDPKSLYEELWDNNKEIADLTMKTDFLQKMSIGSLAAERYINFTLQDIYYLVEVTKMLEILSKKPISSKDLQEFILGRATSYRKFADSVLSEFHLKNADDITPATAIGSYVQSYKDLMKEDPIYFAVALLPCSRLWLYVADSLDLSKTSPYYGFQEGNRGGHPEKHYKALLENHRKDMNENEANNIFKKHMHYEYQFFETS